MIKVNEIRITPEGKLVVDASIADSPEFEGIGFDSIAIDTQDTYIEDGPSSKAIILNAKRMYDEEHPMINQLDGDFFGSEELLKHVHLELSNSHPLFNVKGLDLNNNMLFVYLIVSGVPGKGVACDLSRNNVMRVAVNLHPFYRAALKSMANIAKECCDFPVAFIDSLLRWKALGLAVKTGAYRLAIEYYNGFFKSKKPMVYQSKRCGCHGK